MGAFSASTFSSVCMFLFCSPGSQISSSRCTAPMVASPVMVPRSGVSSPMRIRGRVVLPASEVTTSPVTCPEGRAAEKFQRTCFPSKALHSSRIIIIPHGSRPFQRAFSPLQQSQEDFHKSQVHQHNRQCTGKQIGGISNCRAD